MVKLIIHTKEFYKGIDIKYMLEVNGFDLTNEGSFTIEEIFINGEHCIMYQQSNKEE